MQASTERRNCNSGETWRAGPPSCVRLPPVFSQGMPVRFNMFKRAIVCLLNTNLSSMVLRKIHRGTCDEGTSGVLFELRRIAAMGFAPTFHTGEVAFIFTTDEKRLKKSAGEQAIKVFRCSTTELQHQKCRQDSNLRPTA